MPDVLDDRSSGLLLHPASLPGPYGIGDLGPTADEWLEWLLETGCRYWQILPLGPTGYGDSPYQSFSAFAGNPSLVSPDRLIADGLLHLDELDPHPHFPARRVDYGRVIPWKLQLLDRAHDRLPQSRRVLRTAFERFRDEQAHWLEDYALFMAIKEQHGGGSWSEWPREIRRRERAALRSARDRLASEAARHAFRQFLFFRQWELFREQAHRAGIRIIGDIPVYVAPDSADVWSHPELFLLDDERRPTHVAGVPPDYFSETGQLWGNPLYDWETHAASGFSWWIDRLGTLQDLVDVVRIDHFRAFADYWEIPAGSPTAEKGRWVDGPGRAFFTTVGAALGELPIIAEDLGEVHDVVPRLLEEVELPGMKILQFAFDGDPDNPFLPENYPERCVVYTGTHDNQTIRGWYASLTRKERARVDRALDTSPATVAWDMIDAAWESQAILAVTPLQDVFELGDAARMNRPGTLGGNWSWRFTRRSLTAQRAGRLAALNRRTGRHRDR
jgi:4-alpha-glucanotransferase